MDTQRFELGSVWPLLPRALPAARRDNNVLGTDALSGDGCGKTCPATAQHNHALGH
jgi:hypothetical protein